MYTENYTILLKEIKEDIHKGGKTCCFRELEDVKMSILSKVIYRFLYNPSQNPNIIFFFFAEIEKPILKFLWTVTYPKKPI